MTIGEVFAQLAGVFMFASLLALVNERLVEHAIKPLLVRFKLDAFTGQVAMITGAAITLGFGVDLFSPIALAVGMAPLVPWAGMLVTGLVIGGGSNMLSDVWPGASYEVKKTQTVEIKGEPPATAANPAPSTTIKEKQ